MKHIKVRGARQHNLKNIDIDIPRDKLVEITGLSRSGKAKIQKWYRNVISRGITKSVKKKMAD